MKTQILKSFGGPESLELAEVPKPVPLPAITGHDVSGVVEAVEPSLIS